MALFTAKLTMTGGADKVTSIAGATLFGATQKGVRYCVISNPAGNATVAVGNISVATVTGYSLAASSNLILGPFDGNAPLNANDIYVKGTNTQILNFLLVTF